MVAVDEANVRTAQSKVGIFKFNFETSGERPSVPRFHSRYGADVLAHKWVHLEYNDVGDLP